MKNIISPKVFCLLVLFLISYQVHATRFEQEADNAIIPLYHTLANKPSLPMNERIELISKALLGKPYLLGALGEGAKAPYDQFPLYRIDAFDCETYVDTVLAIAFAKDIQSFKHYIRRIRYKDGNVSYLTRNHFASLDWNPNNQRAGFLIDITHQIKDSNNQPVAKIATALIEKPRWYQKKSIETIRLASPNLTEQKSKLNELKKEGSQLENQVASIPYLPFTALFDQEGKANSYLFKQIPHGALIEIVRPNWNLREKIGTNLNVSHMGFAFWINGELIFRQASTTLGKTVDVSLIDYLQDALNSPTIKGINIQVVIPTEPN